MNGIKTIAVLMSLLIASLPFALAEQLTVQRFSGVDNVNGFARDDDILIVEALAEMHGSPTSEIARQRLKIFSEGSSVSFDNCTKQSGDFYKCTFTTEDIINGGSEAYTIKLYDADNNEKASAVQTLTIDFLEPVVKAYSITPNVTKGGAVNIAYSVEDYASEHGKIAVCSGIKSIVLSENAQDIARITGNKGECAKSGTFAYNVPNVEFKSSSICITAYDYLGQSSTPECRTLKIDKKPPEIKAFEFRDSDGFSFGHVKPGQQLKGDAYVEIIDEGGVAPSKVFADFSALNPGVGRIPASESTGNFFIWRGITVTNPETCSITAEAADVIGNSALKTLNCRVEIDDTGPEAVDIRTEAEDEDETYLVGTNGTIIVELNEKGSGLEKANVFIDLKGIGLGSDAKADECVKKAGDEWECRWHIIPLKGTKTGSVKVSKNSMDDIGNRITKTVEVTVRSDSEAPKNIKITKLTVQHTREADYGNITINGDNVEFTISAEGASTGFANFSQIGGSYVEGICDGNETKNCAFSEVITVAGPLQTKISFELFDRAKNKASVSTDLFIHGIGNETAFNYWKISSVECSPEIIDRSTASLVEHPVYCHIKLNAVSNVQGIMPAFTTAGKLSECQGQISGFVNGVNMINNGAGSKDPYLSITLAPAKFNINQLNISCPVYITTKQGEFVMPNPEREQVNVTLKFHSLPLGELYKNLDDNIEDALDNAENWKKWVEDLAKLMSYFERGCNIKGVITTVLGALDGVLFLLSAAAAALTAWPPAKKAVESTRQTLCTTTKSTIEQAVYGAVGVEGLFNFLDQVCSFINCNPVESGKGSLGQTINQVSVQNPVCSSMKDFVGGKGLGVNASVDDINKKYEGGRAPSSVNVKDSLVWSAACLCIPGIIHNLNKLAQIECRYAVCLARDVKEAGIPSSWCRDEKHYLTCNYVLGNIFSLLPLAHLYNQAVNALKQIFTNPISAVGAVSGCICGGCKNIGLSVVDLCSKEDAGFFYFACSAVLVVAKAGDAIASINTIKDGSYMRTGTRYCEEAVDIKDEIKKAKKRENREP